MDYVHAIARTLDIKIGEPFYIDKVGCNPYTLDINFILHDSEDNECLDILLGLITGDYSKSWKPSKNEYYYYVSLTGGIDCKTYDSSNVYDRYNMAIGNYFKTREQALACSSQIRSHLKTITDSINKGDVKFDC